MLLLGSCLAQLLVIWASVTYLVVAVLIACGTIAQNSVSFMACSSLLDSRGDDISKAVLLLVWSTVLNSALALHSAICATDIAIIL